MKKILLRTVAAAAALAITSSFTLPKEVYGNLLIPASADDTAAVSDTDPEAGTFTVDPIADQTFTGIEITPDIVVKSGDTVLDPDYDYTVKYADNINVGNATVTVTMTGDYTGTASATFTILPRSVRKVNVETIKDQIFTGEPITPDLAVKDYYADLVEGTDYSVEFINNINIGTAAFTITGMGNYTDSFTDFFNIIEAPEYYCLDISDEVYNGSEITPDVTVLSKDGRLISDDMYTVAYSDNINAGTASVKITVNVNPAFIIDTTFVIDPKSIGGLTFPTLSDQKYTGSAITPSIFITDEDKVLIADTDYIVEYRDNINAGTASVVITGIGNYTDEETLTFGIIEAPEGDIVLTMGNSKVVCSSLAEAVKKIDEKKDASLVCAVTVYTAKEEKSFKLPKKAKSLTIETKLDGAIKTAASSLSANYDLTLDANIINTGNKKIAVKMGKGSTLTVLKGFDSMGALSGGKGSKLVIAADEDVSVTDIKGFASVTGNSGYSIIAAGKVAAIGDLSCNLILSGAKASAVVTKVTAANIGLVAGAKNAKTGFYTLPKFTFGSFDEDADDAFFNVAVYSDSSLGEMLTLPNSQPVVFTSGSTEYSTIELDNDIDTTSGTADLFRYGKEYRAEDPDLLEVEGIGTFPSFEKAFAAMNDTSANYTITLNSDISVTKFTLPKAVGSLTINGAGATLDLGKLKTITAKYPLTLSNVTLVAGTTPVAVKTGKFDCTLENASVGAVTAAKLTVNGTVVANGTVSCTELYSSADDTHLTLQSLAVTRDGIKDASNPITLKLIDKTGNTVTLTAGDKKAIVAKTFKGSYTEGKLLLDTNCGTGTLRLEKNKIVLA